MRERDLSNALARFVDHRAAPNVRHKIGKLGDANGVIDVAGRDGFVYVRLATASELMQVLNGGRVATSAEMLDVKVVIGWDAAQQLWRIIDVSRDSSGAGNTITTTDINGSPQTVSANTYQPNSPVGQGNTLVMMSSGGTSTTNITNITYNTTNNTMQSSTSIYQTFATLQKNVIAAAQTVTIASDEYWIVARDLNNQGTLVNNGELVIIG